MNRLTKEELRKCYTMRRKELSQEQISTFSKEIYHYLVTSFSFKEGQKIIIFLPIESQKEVDTFPIVRFLWDKGVNVYVPKMYQENMRVALYTPETPMKKSRWGILEPVSEIYREEEEYDFIIMPLVYVDKKGNRVGYGKGVYDRFLSGSKKGIKIGLNYFPPKEEVIDVSVIDVPLDYLVSAEGVISFSE